MNRNIKEYTVDVSTKQTDRKNPKVLTVVDIYDESTDTLVHTISSAEEEEVAVEKAFVYIEKELNGIALQRNQ